MGRSSRPPITTTHPAVASQWHPSRNEFGPSTVTAGSNRKVWWYCDDGHEWPATVHSRTSGSRCPVCAGRLLVPGVNDLATIEPALASEWHPERNGTLRPDQVMPGSNRRVWWTCSSGHEWLVSVNDRRGKRTGCPRCHQLRVAAGKRASEVRRSRQRQVGARATPKPGNITTTHPAIAAQWHPSRNGDILAVATLPGSNRKVWWMCSEGHEWQAIVGHRTRSPRAADALCPVDRGRMVVAGLNDLASARPDLAAEWHPSKNGALRPDQVTVAANRPVWWQCADGHEWQATPNKRRRTGCPYDAGLLVTPGFNDLASQYPGVAAEWHPTRNLPLTPLDVTAGSGRLVWWRCVKGHLFRSQVASRTTGSGCPSCVGPGFDPAAPSIAYVLVQDSEALVKAGICNVGSIRIRRYRQRGWRVLKTWDCANGSEARALEQAILSVLSATADLDAPDLQQRKERSARGVQGMTEMFDLPSVLGVLDHVLDPAEPTMVQPRIVRKRTDKTADECSIDQFADAGTNRDVPAEPPTGEA